MEIQETKQMEIRKLEERIKKMDLFYKRYIRGAEKISYKINKLKIELESLKK